jgi:hypothetical protein
MSERMLDPKLTGRRPATADKEYASPAIISASSRRASPDIIDRMAKSSAADFEADSVFVGAVEHKNPRKHLMHDGRWIPKEWVLGRPVPRTGVWDCCGELEHLSIYCASEAVKKTYQKETEDIAQSKIDEIERTSKRREHLRNSIKLAQEANPEALQLELTKEEQAIKDACSTDDNGFNAPM